MVDTQDKELLDSISDQYVAKRRKKKKIIYSVLLSVVLALSIFIITFSSVTISLEPKFIASASSYDVYISKVSKEYFDSSNFDSKKGEKFLTEYDKMFSSKGLSALFTGKLGGYQIKETDDSETDKKVGKLFYNSSNDSFLPSTYLKNLIGSNYIRIKYENEQTVLTNSGKIYYSRISSKKEMLKFKEAYMVLSEEGEEINIYLGTYSSTSTTKNTYITKLTVKGSTQNLYNLYA